MTSSRRLWRCDRECWTPSAAAGLGLMPVAVVVVFVQADTSGDYVLIGRQLRD